MDDWVLRMRDISAFYLQEGEQKKALEIQHLDILRGKIIFVLGASGVGKSTLLELAGLMNRSFEKSQRSVFEFASGPEIIDLKKLWYSNESKMAQFRRQNLSFIFQKDNLFGDYTSFENAALSALACGVNIDEVTARINRLMPKLFTKKKLEEIMDGRPVSKISGGERQRVSFVRALCAPFQILFADEPTGNLDFSAAENLMKLLRDEIVKKKKTAIVVSHDIALALNYADKIIVIESVSDGHGSVHGVIKRNSEISYVRGKDFWRTGDSENISKSELEDKLRERINHES